MRGRVRGMGRELLKGGGTMYDLLFGLLISTAAAFAFALAYMAFELLLFIVYKLDGGRMGLVSYFKKLI